MINKNMIAPCGMNCSLCLAYQREKNRCIGCNKEDANTHNHLAKCVIKNCPKRINLKNCCKCDTYPCKRLKQLDKRYTLKYNMSMIDNLNYIDKNGIDSFLKKEELKWKCKKCGNSICVHRNKCLKCDI